LFPSHDLQWDGPQPGDKYSVFNPARSYVFQVKGRMIPNRSEVYVARNVNNQKVGAASTDNVLYWSAAVLDPFNKDPTQMRDTALWVNWTTSVDQLGMSGFVGYDTSKLVGNWDVGPSMPGVLATNRNGWRSNYSLFDHQCRIGNVWWNMCVTKSAQSTTQTEQQKVADFYKSNESAWWLESVGYEQAHKGLPLWESMGDDAECAYFIRVIGVPDEQYGEIFWKRRMMCTDEHVFWGSRGNVNVGERRYQCDNQYALFNSARVSHTNILPASMAFDNEKTNEIEGTTLHIPESDSDKSVSAKPYYRDESSGS